ncbi:MAG TPA: hypothetical protein VEW42_05480 [Candidatus Eisenbacteria bacterium]|nr:hypothetical protein [Candidatus Eisenbacteria bacterium]
MVHKEVLDQETLEQKRLALVAAVEKDPSSKEAINAYANFMEKYVLPAMKAEAQPYSFQEYFALALQEGLRAFKEESYGVGALYVYRSGGKETILFGRQASVNKVNTHLHAEEMVIDEMEALVRGETVDRKNILIRKAPHDKEQKLLFCSLEPCIGCYRRLTANRPDQVLIATADPEAGTMLDGREQMLPTEFWRTRREQKGITVVLPSDDPSSENYINPAYRDLATEMFFLTRPYVDAKRQKLVDGDPHTIRKAARRSKRRIFRKVF